MTTLAEQVAGLEVGDWVEARFEDGQASAVYTDVLQGDKQLPLWLEIREKIIRYKDGEPAEGLVSITRVPRPIPSEPKNKGQLLREVNEVLYANRESIPNLAELMTGVNEILDEIEGVK